MTESVVPASRPGPTLCQPPHQLAAKQTELHARTLGPLGLGSMSQSDIASRAATAAAATAVRKQLLLEGLATIAGTRTHTDSAPCIPSSCAASPARPPPVFLLRHAAQGQQSLANRTRRSLSRSSGSSGGVGTTQDEPRIHPVSPEMAHVHLRNGDPLNTTQGTPDSHGHHTHQHSHYPHPSLQQQQQHLSEPHPLSPATSGSGLGLLQEPDSSAENPLSDAICDETPLCGPDAAPASAVSTPAVMPPVPAFLRRPQVPLGPMESALQRSRRAAAIVAAAKAAHCGTWGALSHEDATLTDATPAPIARGHLAAGAGIMHPLAEDSLVLPATQGEGRLASIRAATAAQTPAGCRAGPTGEGCTLEPAAGDPANLTPPDKECGNHKISSSGSSSRNSSDSGSSSMCTLAHLLHLPSAPPAPPGSETHPDGEDRMLLFLAEHVALRQQRQEGQDKQQPEQVEQRQNQEQQQPEQDELLLPPPPLQLQQWWQQQKQEQPASPAPDLTFNCGTAFSSVVSVRSSGAGPVDNVHPVQQEQEQQQQQQRQQQQHPPPPQQQHQALPLPASSMFSVTSVSAGGRKEGTLPVGRPGMPPLAPTRLYTGPVSIGGSSTRSGRSSTDGSKGLGSAGVSVPQSPASMSSWGSGMDAVPGTAASAGPRYIPSTGRSLPGSNRCSGSGGAAHIDAPGTSGARRVVGGSVGGGGDCSYGLSPVGEAVAPPQDYLKQQHQQWQQQHVFMPEMLLRHVRERRQQLVLAGVSS